jgi:response regulator NasT
VRRLPHEAIDERQLGAAIQLAAARHDEFLRLEAEVTRAHQALEDPKLVERAKGILMDGLGLTEAEAFRRIQRLARDRNKRLADVAALLIDAEAVLSADQP